jgi:hypothetical protein
VSGEGGEERREEEEGRREGEKVARGEIPQMCNLN